MLPETDMSKVYVPAPLMQGGFDTLAEAVKYLYYPDSYLEAIARQNIRYREYEREHGPRGVIDLITGEAPVLGDNPARVARAVALLEAHPIGDIDIQCHPVEKPMTLLGHTFANFAELRLAAELCGKTKVCSGERYRTYIPGNHIYAGGVHVARMDEDYPRFDSCDACDNRMYQNYVFSDRPFTTAMLQEYASLSNGFNYNKIAEGLATDMLPIVYYAGDHNYVQVATRRRPEAIF